MPSRCERRGFYLMVLTVEETLTNPDFGLEGFHRLFLALHDVRQRRVAWLVQGVGRW